MSSKFTSACVRNLSLVEGYCLRRVSKGLLQRLCQLSIGWDEAIPLDLQELWMQWVQALPKLQAISIPRWFGVCKDDSHLELHCFSDASSVDYGAVCYLRVVRGTSRECKFILGKSRVSPIKTVTIPRLELSAATLAIKLARMISKELEVELCRTVYWANSENRSRRPVSYPQ